MGAVVNGFSKYLLAWAIGGVSMLATAVWWGSGIDSRVTAGEAALRNHTTLGGHHAMENRVTRLETRVLSELRVIKALLTDVLQTIDVPHRTLPQEPTP